VDEWLRDLGDRGGALLVRADRGVGRPPFSTPPQVGEPGWEEVADYALSWTVENATVRTVA
jgi:hypothetical protein